MRRRYYFDEATKRMVEVAPEHESPVRVEISTDGHYDGTRALDGTDLSSRRKHREYMQARGLTLADDFKGEWSKAQEERNKFFRGETGTKERREAIARAIDQLERKR